MQEAINEISNDIKNFLSKNKNVNNKINILEGKINKMENYIAREEVIGNFTESEDKALGDFLRKGVTDGLVTKFLSSAEDTAGVTITPVLSHKIITSINAKSPMRRLASVENISTRGLDILIEDGNFTSGWVSEIEERQETDTPKLIKKTITVHEIYAQPKATQSLIDDSEINIENWIVERLSDSFVRLENEAFINGDGTGKPKGILTSDDVESVEFGTDVSVQSLLGIIASLDEGYLANASFLMNRNTLSAIQSLRDDMGRFIWQQSLSDPLKQTIFGIPVYISSNMPNIAGDALSIVFGDFKTAYKIVDRSGISLVRDPYTEKPFIKFYSMKRVGGDVVNPAAIKFAKFTD